MTRDLRHQLDGAHASLRSLRSHADAAETQPALATALRELGSALEELDVAVEELSEQNEALAEARQEIEERRRQEIEEERRRYRELFEEAPEAYVVTDSKGVIARANHRSLWLIDAPAAAVVGTPLAVFVPLDDRVAFRRCMAGSRRVRRCVIGGCASPVVVMV